MSIDIITLILVFALVFCFLPVSAWADDVEIPNDVTEASESAETTEETIFNDSNDADISEPGETIPAPTVAPFDFVLLEESSVQAVERLDAIIDIFSGFLFFLGVGSGMIFFKALSDRIRTV